MNHFKIACGAVALMTMVMVVYFGRSSSPEPEPAVALTPAPTLELMQDPEMVKARQELAYAMTMYNEGPRVVATEAVVPQISQKMRDTVVTPPPKETKPKEHKEHNPCAGNSRRSHKVWISKYKWRCK